MIKRLLFILCILCLFLLTGCTSTAALGKPGSTQSSSSPARPTPAPIEGYMAPSSDTLTWIEWIESSDGHLQGTWENASVDSSTNGLTFTNATVTGLHSGQKISMNVQSGLIALPVTGTLVGNHLHVETYDEQGNVRHIDAYGTTRADYEKHLAQMRLKYPGNHATPTSTAVNIN